MSFVFAVPEDMAAAASDLANIGASIVLANAAAAGPTAHVVAAGAGAGWRPERTERPDAGVTRRRIRLAAWADAG